MTNVGIQTPFQFTPQGTLATVEGPEYVQCQINQVVNVQAGDESGTLHGEYKWMTTLGSVLDLARHHPKAVFQDLLDTFVNDALVRWVPNALFVASVVRQTDRLFNRARIEWTYRAEDEIRVAEAEMRT